MYIHLHLYTPCEQLPLTISNKRLPIWRLSSSVLRVVVNKHGLGAAEGHGAVGVGVESHLEPPPRVLWVPRILQAVLVTLDEELQAESVGEGVERRERGGCRERESECVSGEGGEGRGGRGE